MNTRARSMLLVATAALAGCPSPAPTVPAAAGQPGASPTTPGVSTTVRGSATYLERVKMPPGASLRVELIDTGSGRVLASTDVRDVAGPPIHFALHAPPSPPNTARALRATLIGPGGERWFETRAPVALPPRTAGPVNLPMRRITRADAPRPMPTGPVAHWECGELGVMSRFDRQAGRVRLDYDGHGLALPLARSASGARYADGSGNEFWTKGATGTLSLAGEATRDCVQASQPSPWNAAALRSALFRAVGNEPGWSVEVSGEPPRLAGELDYGERRVDAAVARVTDGWSGIDTTPPLRLHVRRAPCRDAMSGQSFEATVTLEAAGRTYAGCGAWLQD